jgi:phosphatidate cytidylyltransferase
MLSTRIWMGTILAVLAAGVLVLDQWFAPWYPILFIFLVFMAWVGCRELLNLLPVERRPSAWLCYAAVIALILANWPAHFWDRDAWPWVLGTFTAVVLSAFLAEMATFREPGESVTRIALTIWIAAYLGLLPSFFAQLRWLPDGTVALALAIFVPKGCDIGAYFTGHLLGRHRMTPVLSPKKTWEGFAGGMVIAVLIAVGLSRFGTRLHDCYWMAIGFGLTVGLAGVLGDLAESLIKRDCRQKDASLTVPGFGGVLDVVDSVVFAAPVAYLWLIV